MYADCELMVNLNGFFVLWDWEPWTTNISANTKGYIESTMENKRWFSIHGLNVSCRRDGMYIATVEKSD